MTAERLLLAVAIIFVLWTLLGYAFWTTFIKRVDPRKDD